MHYLTFFSATLLASAMLGCAVPIEEARLEIRDPKFNPSGARGSYSDQAGIVVRDTNLTSVATSFIVPYVSTFSGDTNYGWRMLTNAIAIDGSPYYINAASNIQLGVRWWLVRDSRGTIYQNSEAFYRVPWEQGIVGGSGYNLTNYVPLPNTQGFFNNPGDKIDMSIRLTNSRTAVLRIDWRGKNVVDRQVIVPNNRQALQQKSVSWAVQPMWRTDTWCSSCREYNFPMTVPAFTDIVSKFITFTKAGGFTQTPGKGEYMEFDARPSPEEKNKLRLSEMSSLYDLENKRAVFRQGT